MDKVSRVHAIFHGGDKCAYGGNQCPQRQRLKAELEKERQPEVETALKDIATQRLRSEIEPIDGEVQGDFEYAYDQMITVARAALAVVHNEEK